MRLLRSVSTIFKETSDAVPTLSCDVLMKSSPDGHHVRTRRYCVRSVSDGAVGTIVDVPVIFAVNGLPGICWSSNLTTML